MNSKEIYQQMKTRYAQQDNLPWDDLLPPPEVIALTDTLAPASALDLGCGYGRTSIYLAQRGWQVDGIDFVEAAVEEARRRATAAGATAHFQVGDVTKLDHLVGPYALAIDIGCCHALNSAELVTYHQSLKRLLAPDAVFLVYARLKNQNEERGVIEEEFTTLFKDGFALTRFEKGVNTTTENKWRSAWFWWQRGNTSVE